MIHKEMTIFEILQLYPDAYEVLESFGMACGECLGQMNESLEKGAKRHNVDLEKILKKLNELVKKDNP